MNNTLRFSPLAWLMPGLTLIATVFLFVGDPYSFHLRSITELWNLGHVFYFACLTFFLGRWPRIRSWRWWRQSVFVLGAALLLGVFIEWLQYGGQRSTDWMDVVRDLAGSLLMLAFYPGFLAGMVSFGRRLLRLASVLLILVLLAPLTIALVDETLARYQFPLISDFSTPFELDRWEGNSTRSVTRLGPEHQGHQMEIALNTARYSGAGMTYLPSDWRGYAHVHLRLYQPSPEMLGITLRIHDEQHETGQRANAYSDRFNRHFELRSGWNELHIPLADVEQAPKGRSMDLAQIRNVSFFSTELPEPRTLYLDKIYLSH